MSFVGILPLCVFGFIWYSEFLFGLITSVGSLVHPVAVLWERDVMSGRSIVGKKK